MKTKQQIAKLIRQILNTPEIETDFPYLANKTFNIRKFLKRNYNSLKTQTNWQICESFSIDLDFHSDYLKQFLK